MTQTTFHWERAVAVAPACSPLPAGPEEGNSLIFDLGRNSFQVSVLSCKGRQVQVLATGGYSDLGGDDLHLPICAWASDAILQETGVVAETDPVAYAALLKQAEVCKRELSLRDRSQLTLETPGLRWSGVLTQKAYGGIIFPLCQRMEGKAMEVLSQGGLCLEDIDRVIYLGDACRADQVRASLTRRWEKAQGEKRERLAREEAQRAEQVRRAEREAEEAEAKAQEAAAKAKAAQSEAEARLRAARETELRAEEVKAKTTPLSQSVTGGGSTASRTRPMSPRPAASAQAAQKRDLHRARTMLRSLRRKRHGFHVAGVLLFLVAQCSTAELQWLKRAIFTLIEGELPSPPDPGLSLRSGVAAAVTLPLFLWQFHHQQVSKSWGSERHGTKLVVWTIGAWGVHTTAKYLCRMFLLSGSDISELVAFTLLSLAHSLIAALLLPLVWSLAADGIDPA